MTQHSRAEWIGYDAGTRRAWAVADSGAIVDESAADTPADLPDHWGALPLVACGLGGVARALPCAPLPERLTPARAGNGRTIATIPPLQQDNPPDLTCGEETRIAGFLAADADYDGVLCLAGAQTRWALISAGEVVSLQSFLTGELAAALAETPSLSAVLAPGGWNDEAFVEALADALSSPEKLASRLFSLASMGHARARLWGLLIGAELAAARAYWLGRQVAVIGSGPPAQAYGTALTSQGLAPHLADGDDMLLAGLASARALLV